MQPGPCLLYTSKDVANAIVSCIEEEKAANQAYILSAPEVLDYHSFIRLLRDISDLPFTVEEVPLKEITEKNMPLPFPLTEADNELFAGEKITKDPVSYTHLDVYKRQPLYWATSLAVPCFSWPA